MQYLTAPSLRQLAACNDVYSPDNSPRGRFTARPPKVDDMLECRVTSRQATSPQAGSLVRLLRATQGARRSERCWPSGKARMRILQPEPKALIKHLEEMGRLDRRG